MKRENKTEGREKINSKVKKNKKEKINRNIKINKSFVKNIVIIIEIIAILVIVILCIMLFKNRKGKILKSSIDEAVLKSELTNEILYGEEENVKYTGVNEKQNTSEKMQKEKEINGYDKVVIEKLDIVTEGVVTKLKAKVTNKGKSDSKASYVKLQILDDNAEEIAQGGIYVPNLKVGESVELNSTLTLDVANAYDYTAMKVQ